MKSPLLKKEMIFDRIGREKVLFCLPFKVNIFMRNYRDYTDEQIIEYAKEVKSIAELLKRIGKKPAGGNYISIKRIIQRLISIPIIGQDKVGIKINN